jgi:ABC-type transport system involved in resistance to organic solvents, periplasmic component
VRRLLIIGLAVALVAAGGYALWGGRPYRVSVALASATNVVQGAPVQVNGFEAGKISTLEVRDGKAFLDLDLNGDFAPLHDGAVVTVIWKAVLSERRVQIEDGPASMAEIPSGTVLESVMPKPTELDQILNKLDAPTRADLASFVRRLDSTLDGSEADINATLRSAGPALGSLGSVLEALGTDGPAIKALVTRLNGMLTTLADREQNVRTVVSELSRMSSATVQRRTELADTLKELAPTLEQATITLGHVPGVVAEAKPLLDDLHPATERLPSFARNARPLLADLRPLTAELRPTLEAARVLLDSTPGLLDTATDTLPALGSAVGMLAEPLQYLRPYTPELAGFLSNWNSAFANYDSNGKYARVHGMEGTTSFDATPGFVPPGITYDPYPLPGAIVDEPWADAFGSGMR